MHFCFLMEGFLRDARESRVVGPLVQTFLIGRELAARGWRVSYLSLSSSRRAIERETHEGIEVTYLPQQALPMRLGEIAAFPIISQMLRRLDPDVIYTRGRTSMPYIGATHARKHGAVTVWNAARDRDFNRNGYVRMKVEEVALWKRPLAAASYGLTMNTLFERGVRMTDLPIVQNSEQAVRFTEIFPDMWADILPSIIELPEQVLAKPDRFEVLWVGGVKQEKRPEIFLELAERLRRAPVYFTMCGALDDPRYQTAIARAADTNPRFRYLGSVPYAEVQTHFNRASLLVNTSIEEGFPNTYLQAWSASAPVMTLCCDPSDAIARNGLGQVSGDIERMALTIEHYLGNRGDLRNLGRHCRAYVETHHAPRIIVSELIGLIEDVQLRSPRGSTIDRRD